VGPPGLDQLAVARRLFGQATGQVGDGRD